MTAHGETDVAATLGPVRARDEASWEEIYRQLYPRLHAFFARRVGSALAEDAVAETMARAVAGADRYVPGPAGFHGWVFGIARHVAADLQRLASKGRGRPTPPSVDPTPPDPPGDTLLRRDEHAALRKAFEQLDEKDREVLELRVVAGLSAEQVAAVLGKRAGAVRMAQSRALANLRRLMGASDG